MRVLAIGALSLALLVQGAPPLGARAGDAESAEAPTRSGSELEEAPVPSDRDPEELLVPARWAPSDEARPAAASFQLRIGALTVPLRVMALAVQPAGTVEIRRDGVAGGRIAATAAVGALRTVGTDTWTWTAPSRPGFHTVRFVSSQPVDTVSLTFMVMRSAAEVKDGNLNGYAIGQYRPRPASMSAVYEPPGGFIEARPEHHDILVSPNFRLGDFLCKAPGDPRYLVVSPRLLIKLEALLAAVNEAGVRTPGLTVMSGYRTPAYNRAIGNTTDFSRHLWGDAADVFVDVDGDGRMDDLNGDGRSDTGDARWLAGVVERMMAASDPAMVPGGLAAYRPNAAHGPFLHVDARGYRARW
jgi:hypothetical protein